MSVRYEGAGAANTTITIHKAGEEIGADEVPEGEIALAFNYDEVFYLQGKPWEVRALLFAGIQEINENENMGLHVTKLYANFDQEMGGYGDIYTTPDDVRKDHPDDEILTGFGVLDGATGFMHDESADWYDTEEEALAFIRAKKEEQ